ncbi:MAG: protocatechuate 3,4-dioxygenase beta subunit [Planctomycetota bacterium]|jgi:protocatechuate 3,4-dioxygenase beta subunit
MRMSKLIPALSAFVVLAGLGWYSLQNSESVTGDGGALTQELESTQAEWEPEKSLLPKAASKTEERLIADVALEKTPQKTAAASTERVERTVTGRVVDEFGTAIADAEIFIAANSKFTPPNIDVNASRAQFLQIESTRTDTGGEFTFTSSLRGELRVAARSPGYAPMRADRLAKGGDVARLDDLVMESSALLSGHVVDGAGNGVEGVSISSIAVKGGGLLLRMDGPQGDQLAVSDLGGAFQVDQLLAGPFRLSLVSEDHPTLVVDGNVERPGQQLSGLHYVLPDGLTISGRVLGMEAGDPQELVVRAVLSGEGTFANEAGIRGTRLAKIAADGSFQLRGLSAGTQRLNLINSDGDFAGFAAPQSSAVFAEAGDTGVELVLSPPGGLSFRVLDDETGEPVTSFAADARRSILGDMLLGRMEVEDHSDGRMTLEDVAIGSKGMSMMLRITASGYEPFKLLDLPMEAGSVVDLGDLRLIPVPMISVIVYDDMSGDPIEGARVSLSEAASAAPSRGTRRYSFTADVRGDDSSDVVPSAFNSSSGSVLTDENGLAEIASMPGKLCQLSVTHRGHAKHTGEPVKLPVVGGREFEVVMLQGGTVIVLVEDSDGNPKNGVLISGNLIGEVEPGFDPSASHTSDEEGLVTFSNLPAGTHSFKINKSGNGTFTNGGSMFVVMSDGGDDDEGQGQEVVVSEGSMDEITIRTMPEGEIRGVISEGGDPLAGATIKIEEKSKASSGRMRGLPGMGGGQEVMTDGKGNYDKAGLESGDYVMTITHQTRSMPYSLDISIREGTNSEDIDLPVSIVEGRLTDAEGKPAVDVAVTPKAYTGAGSNPENYSFRMVMADTSGGVSMSFGGDSNDRVRTDEYGHYSLRGVDADKKLVIEATSDDFQKAQSEPFEVGPDQTLRGVDIDVFEAGSVAVTVLGKDGNPAGFSVLSGRYKGEADPMPDPASGFAAQDGMAKLTGLRPGTWIVTAQKLSLGEGPGGNRSAPEESDSVEVRVIAGETVEAFVEF